MNHSIQIPLDFPRKNELQGKSIHVLAGDIGGTKTNLALYKAEANQIELITEATYRSNSYRSIIDIAKQFATEHPDQEKPDRICLGVAGPVLRGKVELTNLNWNMDASEIRQAAGVQEVALINDLEATAYGLAGLTSDDFITIHDGLVEVKGNMAIIAPGTGLGEAGLYWDGQCYHPFPTEGGHSDFSPRTKLDVKLLDWLAKKYGIVSWEKVIAGPAIFDIYQFLRDAKKRKEPEWLKEALHKNDPSATISQLALEEKNAACIETMQMYIRYLARETSNLVLKMKATGGLFLGGGIPPKISSLLQQNVFYHNYLDCDRMQHLLNKVPLKIIRNSKTALLGAAWYGAYGAVVE
jgi:glucokinase